MVRVTHTNVAFRCIISSSRLYTFGTVSTLFVWWPWPPLDQGVDCRFWYDSWYTHDRIVLVYYIVHPYLYLLYKEYHICVMAVAVFASGLWFDVFSSRFALELYVFYRFGIYRPPLSIPYLQRVPYWCDGRGRFWTWLLLVVFFSRFVLYERSVLVYIVHPYLYLTYNEYLVCMLAVAAFASRRDVPVFFTIRVIRT